MNKILYVNHKQLLNPSISQLLLEFSHHDWYQFIKLFHYNQGIDSHYIRTGKNTLPFKNKLGNSVPDYNPKFDLPFGQITDQRCIQLNKTHNCKPKMILWSGGVDSTVVVSSILKNITAEDRKNIHIACNRISIYEYPEFYYKHIEPNFHVIDSTGIELNQDLLSQYYIIDGEPADQLFVAGVGQNILFSDPDSLNNNIRNNPDQLIGILSRLIDKEFAHWHYETMLENINSTDIPVESYYDFFWWHAFNIAWDSICLRSLASQSDHSTAAVQSYRDNFIHWYNTPEYQQWAMNNRINNKCDISRISGNKLSAKQYIHDYTGDAYYFWFKLKLYSTGHQRKQYVAPWFCLLEDYTRLYLDRDLDRILELLPEHVQ